MKPTLVILAAGMGSRYGGLKQIDPVGPRGEVIIDYSIFDALRHGFGRLVFVIRRHFEDAFRERVSRKFENLVETAYAHQELESCLGERTVPPGRKKPWGTGHAILVCRDLIGAPFAVINADDYYGPASFAVMADFLAGGGAAPDVCAMVGFELRKTLSDHGSVARGICRLRADCYLQTVVERTCVEKVGDGARYRDADGTYHALTGDETVSMNLWGFDPSIFSRLETAFEAFLDAHGTEPKSEFFIPSVIDALIADGRIRARVLPTPSQWFGVTYREDRKVAAQNIRRLIEAGTYPENLWEGEWNTT